MPGVDGNQITFSTGTLTQKTLPTADSLKLDYDETDDEDVDNEESDVAWPGSHQGDLQRKTFFTEYHLQYNLFLQYRAYIIGQHLVKVLPEILGHDSEGS